MAVETKSQSTDKVSASKSANGQGTPAIKRERRVYDHELTPQEKVALRAVLAAKNVLSALAVSIQEGKGVNVETYRICIELQKEAGFTLFGV